MKDTTANLETTMTTTATATRLYTVTYHLAGGTLVARTVTVTAACLKDALDIVYCDYDALAVLEVHSEGVRLY